ncbi:hypothetical protein HPB49_013878 [Dermacentor silvarum]|uniref:Uncharacterized protein n=1 Tax=Dermacentor silvarum TaxID=543639 RepID=A0ACB8DP44_DERSI|nr:hypothetical protein HPB49_013878 [Dermacentor silvarum]
MFRITVTGHGTVTVILRSPLMFVQVLLLIFLGRPWSVSSMRPVPTTPMREWLNDTSSPWLGAFSSTDCGLSMPFLASSPLVDAPPLLDAVFFSVWQRGTESAEREVPKCAHSDATLGHGTVTVIQRSPLMFVQVSYYDAYSYRDDDVCLLAVSGPPHVLKSVRASVLYLMCLLVLGGDVELNPGPMTKAQEEKLDLVAGSILRAEASNSVLQESVNKVLQSHLEIKNDLEKLTKRVLDLEQKFAAAPSAQSIACSDNGLVGVQEKIDDLENRSRRSNVLFYGITDSAKSETWEESERLVNNFCTEKLGLTVTSISRAHRVGRFSSKKKRPIIAKFFNEKEVELVLSRGFKLKNTSLSISRDYSETVREKRRKLLQFSRTVKKDGDRVRLVFNKLHLNNDVYEWNTNEGQAVLVSRRRDK